MILTHFSINNYRGTVRADLIPISSLSIFVGKNDSGKSIALNAIAAYLDIKNHPILDIDFNNKEQPIIFDGYFSSEDLKYKVSKVIGTKIKKDDGKDEFIDDVCINNEFVCRQVINNPGKAYAETLIRVNDYDHEELSMLYAKPDEEINAILIKFSINVPVSGSGRNSKIEKIKHIKQYCEAEKIAAKFTWISDEYGLAKLLPEIELFKSDYGIEADTVFKTTSVTEIKDVIDTESGDGGRLGEVANTIEQEMGRESEAIAKLMKQYVPNIKTLSITPSFAWKDAIKSVDVSFEFEDDEKPINMTRKGSGYRRLFMVARFRYLAEKKKGEDIIYAIEEPETFLHPGAQEDLLSALDNLSQENQIILATHSPVFAGSSDKSAIILCEKTENGSVYTTEADNPDMPKRIIEELGIRPHHNLTDSYKKILFCESKNDIMFFDQISKAMLGKNIIGNEDILVLPGGGDSLEDIINIHYFTKTNRDLFLITDSDKHQDVSKQNQNKERANRFNKLDRAEGYLLKKACIENYYHPRALERIYSNIPEGTCEVFEDDANVKQELKKLAEETGAQIKHKNDHEVFQETTKKEWEEIIEDGLIEFLMKVTS